MSRTLQEVAVSSIHTSAITRCVLQDVADMLLDLSLGAAAAPSPVSSDPWGTLEIT